MNSRLPEPGPDWKTDPRSFVLLVFFSLILMPLTFWVAGQGELIMSLPYTEIGLGLAGLCVLAMAAIIGYLWWQQRRAQRAAEEQFREWYRPPARAEDPVAGPRSGDSLAQPQGPAGPGLGWPPPVRTRDAAEHPRTASRPLWDGEPSVDLPYGQQRLRDLGLSGQPPESKPSDFQRDSLGTRDSLGMRASQTPRAAESEARPRLGEGATFRAGPSPAAPEPPIPNRPHSERSRREPPPVIQFQSGTRGTRPVSLTLEQLQRLLFISGRPGCGKTTILRAIARAAQRSQRPGAPVCHTVTFDANRSLAEYAALESLRAGREPVVLELGAREHLVPYQFPRPGLGGDEAAAEAIRRAWFSFDREIPAQLRDAIVHDFRLLAASGYGFDQCLRVLVSESFRDEVLRLGQARLSHHTGAWLALTSSLPRTEWYRKFSSTLARLFQLLENDATRLALAGRGEFSFERLNDRAYTGPGLDIIVTATGQMDDELIYFVFGILFSELASVLRARLEGAADGRWPEIVILADELGRYGGAEAILDLLSSGRNVRVKVAAATHSLMSLPEGLRTLIPVLAVNRIAGGEVGQGAALAAGQLLTYQPDLLKALGPDGKPALYWSAEEQLREFQDWLQQVPDHEFAVRLSGQKAVVRGRALADAGLFPDPRELSRALAEASRRSGQPVAEVRAELDRINHELDNRFGPIDYRAETPLTNDETDWRTSPDDTLPHI